MARRRMPSGLARYWRNKRGGAKRRASRRPAPKVRTRTRTVVQYRSRGRSRQGGFLNPFGFVTSLLVPAIGVAASGLVVRAVPWLDTPMKRGAGAIAGGLALTWLGRKVGVPAGLASGLALGMGIDGAWRLSAPLRAQIPALAGGGPTGGLLSGRLSSGGRATRSSERAAYATQ